LLLQKPFICHSDDVGVSKPWQIVPNTGFLLAMQDSHSIYENLYQINHEIETHAPDFVSRCSPSGQERPVDHVFHNEAEGVTNEALSVSSPS
jgi:hypothetical protein